MRPGYSNQVRYLGIFLGTMSVQANSPTMLAFSQSNIVGSSQRAVAGGVLIGCGGIGGIIGSTIFRAQDAPDYDPGITTTMAFAGLNIVGTAILTWVYSRRNKAADRDGTVIGGISGFRYAL